MKGFGTVFTLDKSPTPHQEYITAKSAQLQSIGSAREKFTSRDNTCTYCFHRLCSMIARVHYNIPPGSLDDGYSTIGCRRTGGQPPSLDRSYFHVLQSMGG